MIAALNMAPDVDAFLGGVYVGLAAILLVLAIVGGLAIFRRIVGA